MTVFSFFHGSSGFHNGFIAINDNLPAIPGNQMTFDVQSLPCAASMIDTKY